MEQEIQPATNPGTPVTHMNRLTSSEIGNLWRVYMNYTMLTCIMKVFLSQSQDPDIRSVCQSAHDISQRRIKTSSDLLTQDNRSVPHGFTDEDIDINAPALYSDTFYIYYIKNMIKVGLNVLSMALTMATRLDVIAFFRTEIDATMDIWNKTATIMLEKGMMIRPPYMETDNIVHYVHKEDNFLGSVWSGDRPLLAIEVEQLYYGIITNEVGKTLLTGFHQVTPSKQLRDYINKGIELSGDIIQNFGSKLRDGGITSPMHWDAYGTVTNSTTPPFSDKLMIFHINMLNTIGMANYAISLGSTFRKDLVAMYGRYIGQVVLYAAKGLDLAIDNGWLEEPPIYLDRQNLINEKKH